MTKNQIVKTGATADIHADIERCLRPLGGIEKFIKPGETVLLKPNLNTADPYPASTSVDFLAAVIDSVKNARPGKIIIGDSCTISQNTEKVMSKLGIFELGRRMGVEVVNFDKGKFVTKEIPGQYLKSVQSPAIVDEVDRIIILPCLKVHRYARFTMSLKIAVGLMKKFTRVKLHTGGHLEEKIAEINLAYQPDLIILDGRQAFITNGPESGDTVTPNVILAGTDRIAIDVEALKILQNYPAENKLLPDVWQSPVIKHAMELKIGMATGSDYRVVTI